MCQRCAHTEKLYKECQQKLTNQEALILILQSQLSKIEGRYIESVDEVRQLEYKNAVASGNLYNLKILLKKYEDIPDNSSSRIESNEFGGVTEEKLNLDFILKLCKRNDFGQNVGVQCSEDKTLGEAKLEPLHNIVKRSVPTNYNNCNSNTTSEKREVLQLRCKLEEVNKELLKATQEMSYLILKSSEKDEKILEYEQKLSELQKEKLDLQEKLKNTGESIENLTDLKKLTSWISQYIHETMAKECGKNNGLITAWYSILKEQFQKDSHFFNELSLKDNKIKSLKLELEILKRELDRKRQKGNKKDHAVPSRFLEFNSNIEEKLIEDRPAGISCASIRSKLSKRTNNCEDDEHYFSSPGNSSKAGLFDKGLSSLVEDTDSEKAYVNVVKKIDELYKFRQCLEKDRSQNKRDETKHSSPGGGERRFYHKHLISRRYKKPTSPKASCKIPSKSNACGTFKVNSFKLDKGRFSSTEPYAGSIIECHQAEKATLVSNLLSHSSDNKIKTVSTRIPIKL